MGRLSRPFTEDGERKAITLFKMRIQKEKRNNDEAEVNSLHRLGTNCSTGLSRSKRLYSGLRTLANTLAAESAMLISPASTETCLMSMFQRLGWVAAGPSIVWNLLQPPLVPADMVSIREMHWGQEGVTPFPQKKSEIVENLPALEIVEETALSVPEVLHPLIIRPGYKEIKDKLLENLSKNNTRGICIFGHPGSGTSTCLWYLLIHMLRHSQPVVWVEEENFMYLFGKDHVERISPEWFERRRLRDPNVVILYDAAAGKIPQIMWGNSRRSHYLVLATSPPITVFKKWMETEVDFMTMNFFTREELAWLKHNTTKYNKPADAYDVLTVYDLLGPSLKTLKNKEVKKLPNSTLSLDFTAHCAGQRTVILREPANNWLWPNDQHTIFRIAPEHDIGPDMWSEKPAFKVELPSTFMAKLFFGAVQLKDILEMIQFASNFTPDASMRGALFKAISIRYLSWASHVSAIVFPPPKEVEPNLVSTLPLNQQRSIPDFVTTSSIELALVPNKPPSGLILHVAPIKAPTFDALYQFEDGKIALFQMTVAKRHEISQQGLVDVLACYTTATHTACLEDFILVFVVPSQESAEPYLRRYANGKTFRIKEADQHLTVGALVIDFDNAKSLEILMKRYRKLAYNLWNEVVQDVPSPVDVMKEQKPVISLEDIVDPEVDGVDNEVKESNKSTSSPSEGAASAAKTNPPPKSVPRLPSDSGIFDAEAAPPKKRPRRSGVVRLKK